MRHAYAPHSLTSALAAALARMNPTVPLHHTIGYQPGRKPVHDRPRSRYMPHQGEREMARRRAQMLKAYGKSPVTRFYGALSGGE